MFEIQPSLKSPQTSFRQIKYLGLLFSKKKKKNANGKCYGLNNDTLSVVWMTKYKLGIKHTLVVKTSSRESFYVESCESGDTQYVWSQVDIDELLNCARATAFIFDWRRGIIEEQSINIDIEVFIFQVL